MADPEKHIKEEPPKPSNWVILNSDITAPTAAHLVMAWAKDHRTGEPKFIFEIGPERRGANSGCVCYGCGSPLIAVNAAKSEFKVRPHFRHPSGTENEACTVLSARAAALEMLLEQDAIVLPARKVGATVVGVSGKTYSAWVEKPAEPTQIRAYRRVDQVDALLTLADGREVLVRLRGSLQQDVDHAVTPVVQLLVDSPDLAGMSPAEIKSRLSLLLERSSWCGGPHWDDGALAISAKARAQEMAADALDWAPDYARQQMSGPLTNEGILHWQAKEILREVGRIHVPAVIAKHPGADSVELGRRQAAVLELSNVRLEQSLGQVRPDIFASYLDPMDGSSGTLLIEITVTNQITEVRESRLRAVGVAALEVNLSQLGGTITRPDLSRLLTEEPVAKRWIFHPWVSERLEAYEAQRVQEDIQWSLELERIRLSYLQAVAEHASLLEEVGSEGPAHPREPLLRQEIRRLGEELSTFGLVGAADEDLFLRQGAILHRLLSIRDNRVVGYRLHSLWQVINTILCERGRYSMRWHTLYLIALKVYAPHLRPDHQRKVRAWRDQVLESLQSGKETYRRDHRMDELIGFLFPEMKKDLMKRVRVVS